MTQRYRITALKGKSLGDVMAATVGVIFCLCMCAILVALTIWTWRAIL
jgi:uncharacterized membrane protein YraQ (UPF0718 family)